MHMLNNMKQLVTLLLIATIMASSTAIVSQTQAVEYQVFNNAIGTTGSARFEKEIGIPYTVSTLARASNFTWQIFRQGSAKDRKNVTRVRLYIEDFDGVGITRNSDISISASFIGNYTGDVKEKFTSVVYHEVARVWQWLGNDQAPEELIGGIADFVMTKAMEKDQLLQPQGTRRRGGGRGDVPWEYFTRFLEYLNGKDTGFIAELNRRMKTGYSDNIFVEMTGKAIDKLWSEFQTRICRCHR